MTIESNGPADNGSMAENTAAPTETAPQPEKGLRAAFDAALAEQTERETPKAPAAEQTAAPQKDPAAKDPAAPDATAAPETAPDYWSRSKKYKFARATPEERAEMLAAPIEAPNNWPASRREMFAKQPREVQEAWLGQVDDYDAAFTQRNQEQAQKVRFADDVRGMFTDEHRAAMQRAGVADEAGAFKYLLAQHDLYTRDPVRYVATVMQNAGIDPRMFIQNSAGQPAQAGPQQSVHPALVQELGTLRSTVAALQTAEQQRLAAQVDATIDQFASAKDASGNLLHPHFDHVADRITELLAHDPRITGMRDGGEKLAAAYRLAVATDDALQAEIIDAEVRRRVSEASRAQQTAAPRPAASIKPTAGASAASAQGKPRGIRGAFEDALRERTGH